MKLLAGIFVAFLFCSPGQAEDWQYWSTLDIKHRITEKDTVSLLSEGYFRHDMSDDYVYLTYLSYQRTLGHGFSLLGQGYIEAVEDQNRGWGNSEYAVFGPIYQEKLGEQWQLKAQIRFFYQVDPDAQWDYYRPRISLIHQRENWSFVLEDEMRVDLTGDREARFFRNRVFLTCFRKIADYFSIGLGYLRQEDKSGGSWVGFNGLQTVLKFDFLAYD